MNIAITGASGFIGRRLVSKLQKDGHTVVALGRQIQTKDIEGQHAVIHLAGEPVSQRWTPEAKRRIRESRIEGTRHLVAAIAGAQDRPRVLVSSSATGYYGHREDEILRERSGPGEGFLADICVGWEKEALNAANIGLRVVCVRTGVVLGRDGGALAQMIPPFRAGVGGPIAGGKQWMSWIHLDDLVELYAFALLKESLSGPCNGVSPEPVRNSGFTEALAQAVHRPALIPVPQFALKVMFGEMSEVVISSQRVIPEAALTAKFSFKWINLLSALRDAL